MFLKQRQSRNNVNSATTFIQISWETCRSVMCKQLHEKGSENQNCVAAIIGSVNMHSVTGCVHVDGRCNNSYNHQKQLLSFGWATTSRFTRLFKYRCAVCHQSTSIFPGAILMLGFHLRWQAATRTVPLYHKANTGAASSTRQPTCGHMRASKLHFT